MALYTITTGNWNDPAFWSSINESSAGHTLDFSTLPSNFSVTTSFSGIITITDGATTFTIGESGVGGTDANFGGGTLLDFFTSLLGSQGNDILSGTAAADTIDGGGGNDTIIGGAGADTLSGGGGDDTFVVSAAPDANGDVVTGGDASDDLDVLDLRGAGPVTIDRSSDVSDDGGYEGTVTFSDGSVMTFSGIEAFLTDAVDGEETGETMGVGYDDAFGATDGGGDLITNGDDTIYANGGDDTVFAGGGNDEVYGGEGKDTLDGGAGTDTLYGGEGNDRFVVGDGADTVYGGLGSDFVFVQDGFDGTFVDLGGDGIVVNGYNPSEFLTFYDVTTTVDIVFTSANSGTATTSTGDVLTFENVDGFETPFDLGGTADFSLAGYDILFYDYGGVTSVVGSAYNDYLAASGADPIGAPTDRSYDGGAGDDHLDTGEGNDTIIGGSGDDFILARGGDDTIDGGTGTDLIYAGTGSDTILLNDSFGNDTIFGEEDPDDLDIDVIDASGITNGGVTVTATDKAGSVTQGADSADFSGIESFVLTDQADTFTGAGTSAVTVDAGGGDDTITGGFGDDILLGGAGSDTVDGGAGSDTLDGGAGIDTLTGGAGPDVFVADGTGDLITDFDATTGIADDGSANNDFVDLSAYYNETTLAAWNAANPGNTYNDPLSWMRADQADGSLDEAGGLRIQNGGSSVDGAQLNAENTGVVCFTSGTLIATPHGEVPIETLKQGDLVLTRDNGPQPLAWIGHRHISGTELAGEVKLRPIEIKPRLIKSERSLIVSRQHGVLLNLDGEETLVRAIHLTKLPGAGARIMHGCRDVTYIHLMFEEHQIIFAGGAPSESFHPGPQALAALNLEARTELSDLFPELPSTLSRDFAHYSKLRHACLSVA